MLSLIFRLWWHIASPRKRQLGALLVVMIVASFAEVLSISAVLPFIAALTTPETVFHHALGQPIFRALDFTHPEAILLPLTVFFVFMVIISGAVRILLLWLQTRIAHAIGSDINNDIFKRTLYQPYQAHLSVNSSEVISGAVIKARLVVTQIVLPLITVASSTLMLIVVVALLIAINPLVAVIALGGLSLIYLLIILLTRAKLAANGEKINQSSGRVIKTLQEGIGGIRDVIIDGTQRTYCSIYRDADVRLRHAQTYNAVIGLAPRFLVESLGISLIAALAYTATARGEGLTQLIPTLAALALGAQRLLPVVQQMYQSWTNLKSGLASLDSVLELLDRPTLENVSEPAPVPIKFANSIRLDNVSFSYSVGAPAVLRNISLEIKKGARIGFVGTTGCGKSTLLDILMGLLVPSEGFLKVDGTVISHHNQRSWQANISHVPQAIFLADTSIAENIAFGIPVEKIDFQRVKAAAEKAQMAKTIECWEENYGTLVGERGVRLSGGQRQRVGIARAFYKQASVLIFDEATSALDAGTESAVIEAINTANEEITVLQVAHRLGTLYRCDVVYKLSDGELNLY
jgi:ABC-type multidrug transport system fused ATPase/permease subunit